jgi:hypothetical protein
MGALLDAAAILASWAVLLLAESVAVSLVWGEQFTGVWEMSLARRAVVPVALVVLAPMSIVAAAGWTAAVRAGAGQRAPAWGLAIGGAVALGAIAIGDSHGRHFSSATVRVPFVLAMAFGGGLAGGRLIPRVAMIARRPQVMAAVGVCVMCGAWLADSYVLPRLYPWFHAGLLAWTLAGSALVGLALRSSVAPDRAVRVAAVVFAAIVALCAAWTPRALRTIGHAANLRVVLVEHAPLLGRAVAIAVRIRPPDADDVPTPGVDTTIADRAVARSLDWTGHDLVLLTVDALRADHVSGYGYVRDTTPNIDALAREGTLFESAYCPTPHTSYSVTSMLTGKYLRPLMALGLGEDSETWAQALRRYGWRTAAFYPPAVFFIDEDRFVGFAGEHLGFEYAKVEFVAAAHRENQVAEYLEGAAPEVPIFLWVHFFEPHEPYVVHAEHVFPAGPSPDIDAYDSEIAAADEGIGRIVRLVRTRRPGAVVIVTADHGEEFGEHGGHYHGTTVYEEQVRVPLIVVGPGVRAGARVAAAVQTIDLLPTALSSMGMPRPARIRGRDIGSLLAGDPKGIDPKTADGGFAFAETDDYALVATGAERLVCQRRAAACALYRLSDDPGEHHDVSSGQAERFASLRATLRAVEQDHGRYETSGGPAWPEALRRGIQGDADAALDVASLLDDADVAIRRKAAEVCFRLHVPTTTPAVRRSLARDEDDEVRRWSALAVARMGEPVPPVVDALLKDANHDWRRRAALTLGERGDARACDEIGAWWADILPPAGLTTRTTPDGEPPRLGIDLESVEELLLATGKAHCRAVVPALVRALADVRARPHVADALGVIGDDRARAPLLALFATEPYVTARPHEARALLALGARDWWAAVPAPAVTTHLTAPAHVAALRLLVLLSEAGASLDARAAGRPLAPSPPGSEVRALDLPDQARPPRQSQRSGERIEVDLRVSSGGVVAAWLLSAGRLD